MTPWTVAPQAPLTMEFSRQEYWSNLPFPSPGDLPNPGIKPKSPTLQVDYVPSESPGKPKNTEVGSLSLLQGNFLTQELNWGLLHCRRILYQLSYLRGRVSGPRLNNKQAVELLFEFSSFRHQSPGTRTSLPAPALPPLKASWQGQV